jgi:hypothetical protein
MKEIRVLAEPWGIHFNTVRPHPATIRNKKSLRYTNKQSGSRRSGRPIETPVFTFTGSDNIDTTLADVNAWSHKTQNFGGTVVLSGGHFFLHAHADRILQKLLPNSTQADVITLVKDAPLERLLHL